MIAHATAATTQHAAPRRRREPFWVVNEGEYCMAQHARPSVDHVFWELKQNPWVVKNCSINFVRPSAYVDTVGGAGRGENPAGRDQLLS